MSDSTYQPKVYRSLGGNKLAVASGGVLDIETGGALQFNGVAVSPSSGVDGVTASAAEINVLDGITATTAELNKLAGFTGTTANLNTLTAVTGGTVSASKAVVVNTNLDITGFRNLTATGRVTADSVLVGTVSAGADASGNCILSVPSTDPGVAGALWVDGVTLKISAGA